MELLTPKLGLFVWTLIIFLILFFMLKKLAWKPIIQAIKDRESSIEDSLAEAQRARDEMANLKSENEALLRQAREERDKMMAEARTIKDKMIEDAKTEASEEATRIVDAARRQIQSEKNAAVAELKDQVAQLSLDIAEKVLRKELSNKEAQKETIDQLVKELHLN